METKHCLRCGNVCELNKLVRGYCEYCCDKIIEAYANQTHNEAGKQLLAQPTTKLCPRGGPCCRERCAIWVNVSTPGGATYEGCAFAVRVEMMAKTGTV